MNMPSYFYDAARIFERRAAVDAGKAADVWLFYDVNGDEFYYSSYRAGRDDQKICAISEIDSGDYREFADVDFNEIYDIDFNVLTSVEKYAPIVDYICGFAETLADEADEIRKVF
ncbi:MAG: hypothetical protein J6W10_01960 [Kiritimatiellae bacterium]|nr:hypothetical protein [Kiritimatiellia bacterium]